LQEAAWPVLLWLTSTLTPRPLTCSAAAVGCSAGIDRVSMRLVAEIVSVFRPERSFDISHRGFNLLYRVDGVRKHEFRLCL
jgi:hypothetical protein